MVYFEQRVIIPPDILQRFDTLFTQLNTSEKLPSYVEMLNKRMEWSLKHVEEVVRVADRFVSGLELLTKVGIGVLSALVVLIAVGCVLIREMDRMGEEGKRENRKEVLRGELKGE